jgi:Domain of unknown function (DUF4177)
MLTVMEVTMQKSSFPTPSGSAPLTPMVYVRDKGVWQYKLITRNVAKEETPSEEELNRFGKDGWELVSIVSDKSLVHFYFKRMKD